MLTCASCSSFLDEGSRFCPQCGEAVTGTPGPSALPTVTAPPTPTDDAAGRRIEKPAVRGAPMAEPPLQGGAPRSLSHTSDSIDQARFTPGTVVGERYRVVGLLGKGGMGEVYRADDLKLRQPVALKFLPRALARDAHRLERFHHEVRIARQVSHPNVCRVYDIGETGGQPFITMEFVDGEDLASVLRRMGPPSPDKALQIARQLCAGLAASHDKGVLHRDLKPHNVMIDGRGRVRVTDFGLAGFVEDFAGADVSAGTPAYMAPEQLAGREVSVKSDIYSLGLVLFELFTGRRPFEGDTIAEQRLSRSSSSLSGLPTISGDVDPAVERVILRCLHKEPSARPTSALAVAAALPGGDPLAAALAAGETPDPSMVAAAGEAGGMRPAVAVSCFVGTLVLLAVVVGLSQRVQLINRVPLPYPPEVLTTKAREIITDLGYDNPPVDSAYAFFADQDYFAYVKANDKSPDRWSALDSGAAGAIKFWYRQSPEFLRPLTFFGGGGQVSPTDPPLDQSGMASVKLDASGNLQQLTIVPPQVDPPSTARADQAGSTWLGEVREDQGGPTAEPAEPDWSLLFDKAGLELASLQRTEPTWTPPVWADVRAAWTGPDPHQPGVAMRIEAASYRGKPVYFERILPWTRPERMQPFVQVTGEAATFAIGQAFFLTILIGSILIARRNLRLGRGDRRGASRLALFVLVAGLLAWAFSAHHLPAFYEFGLFVIAAGWSLFLAAMVWLVYIAVEPYVRRRSPHILISWSRLLSGRLRDPLVGRDLLVGALFGGLICALIRLRLWGASWFGAPPPAPAMHTDAGLLGISRIVAHLLDTLSSNVFFPLGFVLFLFLLQIVFRKVWLAAVVFVLILTTYAVIRAEDRTFEAILSPIIDTLIVVVLLRFGVLALVVTFFIFTLALDLPLTYDFNVWYFRSSLFAILAIMSIAAYGFHLALAGRSLIKDELLES